jgi:hypothetical protein
VSGTLNLDDRPIGASTAQGDHVKLLDRISISHEHLGRNSDLLEFLFTHGELPDRFQKGRRDRLIFPVRNPLPEFLDGLPARNQPIPPISPDFTRSG